MGRLQKLHRNRRFAVQVFFTPLQDTFSTSDSVSDIGQNPPALEGLPDLKAFEGLANLEGLRPLLPMLVTGVPGVPGYNAFLYFRRLFGVDVDGLVPEHSDLPAGPPLWPLPPSGLVRFDAEKPEILNAWFATRRYRSVIDASGWCALKAAELDPKLARRLNIDIGLNVLRAAKAHGARVIRLSSDLVFSGDLRPDSAGKAMVLGGYREEEKPDPVTVYGKCMAEAEGVMLDLAPETWVLRVSLPMGPSANDHAGAVDWIDSRFRRNLPATLYYDEVRTPIYVQDLNRVLAHMLMTPGGGILHVGGPRRLSLNQIAQVVNVAGGYDPALLHGCMRHAAGPMPPRAGDVTMAFDKLEGLIGRDRISPWPASSLFTPKDGVWSRTWHQDARRETREDGVGTGKPEKAIERHLYGMGWPELDSLEAKEKTSPPWDHPMVLLKHWRSS